MKLIKPFRGLRPTRELAANVASHPYDVLNREEAYALAKDNPHSFLHINKPEVDVDPELSVYDRKVYEKGSENLQRFIEEGILVRDDAEQFYVYQQQMGNHIQVGLVAAASVAAYEADLIKKHEFTRPDKEDDRVHHMDALGAQVGPVFLTYKAEDSINNLIAEVQQNDAEYDFTAEDGTRHTFWLVSDAATTQALEEQFNRLECLYVADGHHRSAAASRVQKLYEERNGQHQGDESYNWFLVVLFPHDQMQILDYNRIIKDLGSYSASGFLEALESKFNIEKLADVAAAKPTQAREFALYLDSTWYRLTPGEDLAATIDDDDPVLSLDVSIMQEAILTPFLGIEDQRTDKRIDFVGGIRGLQELEKRVDSGEWAAAIALYATSIESLMDIADANEVMPPKSTWFEPKLKSGLVVHVLD